MGLGAAVASCAYPSHNEDGSKAKSRSKLLITASTGVRSAPLRYPWAVSLATIRNVLRCRRVPE